MGRIRSLWVLLGLVLFTVSIYDFHVSADVIPSENECRPYIEKAIHELKNVEAAGSDEKESTEANVDDNDSIETDAIPETGTDDDANESAEDIVEKAEESDDDNQSQENQTDGNESGEEKSQDDAAEDSNQDDDSKEQTDSVEGAADDKSAQETDNDSKEQAEDDGDSKEKPDNEDDSKEQGETDGDNDSKEEAAGDSQDDDNDSKENTEEVDADSKADDAEDNVKDDDSKEANDEDSKEGTDSVEADDEKSAENTENQTAEDDGDSKEDNNQEDSSEVQDDTKEDESVEEKVRVKRSTQTEAENDQSDEKDDQADSAQNDDNDDDSKDQDSKEADADGDSKEVEGDDEGDSKEVDADGDSKEAEGDADGDSKETDGDSKETDGDSKEAEGDSKEETKDDGDDSKEDADKTDEDDTDSKEDVEEEESPEEDLTMIFEIPKNLRPHEHVDELLGLDVESSIKENALRRTGDVVLKDLKKVFDNAIKPLETLYKYRDLSNRHFGDPEIFSKPLVLFMGPWSGGKSTILNYLTGNEYTPHSIRSGAEPSPAYFNILMHGDEPEVLDGTQLAADWTFSGLQKFGQGLMDRLRGQKLPNKLLERVNIVEIPGILEVRKQVSRYFPFNDACQWFIDRADIIFLVYDPSKLDVGPETEAILDQLKGREYQTRILLNKADQVKPEELLRVQGALIWNISPLMSSAQPPIMYTVSLWSHPYTSGAPVRLLQAQERAFLSDLREAIDKRIENKIASARRFAVRIRNHAKMVDCYLTTYYNQKGLFSNKKQVADKIIEHPQNYNIYEGLSTLTNISRYDLPDPEVYLDFFRLNPLFEFKKLSETCTYFKGCPINKLDIAIAYELPELVGKYKKLFEQNLAELRKEYEENCNQTEPEPPMKIIKSR